jgi:hypothetical protein
VSHKKTIGEVEVQLKFARHMGPRFIHGAVTLQFSAGRAYSFSSNAHWPSTNENYEQAIRLAIEETLAAIQGHLNTTSVVLKSIEWDEISSCQSGFERAARAATLAAFEV